MKSHCAILAGIAVVFAAGAAKAEKPLKDYSFIRGVNYGMNADQATLEKELGYAKRVNLNSTRIWLNYTSYERDPKGYIDRLRNYVRTSQRLGFSTMPILFNGNSLNPDTLKPEFRSRGDAYAKAIVEALKDEPGLLMWDIMNEPTTNDYYDRAPADQKQQRLDEINAFVRYYLSFVKKIDPVNATTVGWTFSSQIEYSGDLEDVLSFHDYTETRAKVEAVYTKAEEFAKKLGKPILNTETACIARANPYDEVLEIAQEHKTGWYLFNLMVSGYWGQIHGIFYPDGTVRDPAIISAIMGFYRKRDIDTMIRPVPNREGAADRAIRGIEAALKGTQGSFNAQASPTDRILDAAEYAANLLESAEMVPMFVPPTAQIKSWRALPENKRDANAIRQFAYDLGVTLKKYCLLY